MSADHSPLFAPCPVRIVTGLVLMIRFLLAPLAVRIVTRR
jgi:hypothetical protein